MQSFRLGDVEITKLVEWQGEIAPARTIVPESPPEIWRDNESWLAPDHWHPDSDSYHGVVQTWVLRSQGKVILIDTGVGNDRHRPQIPLFDHLHTGFLDRLAELGIRPQDVDIVVNTHIHYDHVGWNTEARDGEWLPTFPNATYLIPRIDKEFFDPRNAHRRRAPRDEQERLRMQGSHIVYTDSITPVLDRAQLWEKGYRIDDNLTLEPAPGHTPGSAIVRLASGSDRAVFVGDLLHSPVQILEPAYSSCFCDDPQRAAATRRTVLEHAADTNELVIPAHFAGPGAAEIQRDGTHFTISQWAPVRTTDPASATQWPDTRTQPNPNRTPATTPINRPRPGPGPSRIAGTEGFSMKGHRLTRPGRRSQVLLGFGPSAPSDRESMAATRPRAASVLWGHLARPGFCHNRK